jgi:hypothetical protein
VVGRLSNRDTNAQECNEAVFILQGIMANKNLPPVIQTISYVNYNIIKIYLTILYDLGKAALNIFDKLSQ